MILELIDEAVAGGARLSAASDALGLSSRTIIRWRGMEGGGDMRKGPNSPPANKLDEPERQQIVDMANSPEYRDKSPKQIVPLLADQGIYIASESSFYRVLKEHEMINPSFSRPMVSDDNPYSEALFRTMKYRPEYPSGAFETIEQAQAWVDNFVLWYNTCHLHSAIRFVTPDDRHYGREDGILEKRRKVYEVARRRNPSRWSKETRKWDPVQLVWLNPDDKDRDALNPCLREAA